MRKNQKYTKEEMYLAIEIWQESDMSQNAWCKQNNISSNTFKYWLKRYRDDKAPANPAKTFLPVELTTSDENNDPVSLSREITITYPNGIQVNCPVSIEIHQLLALIKL